MRPLSASTRQPTAFTQKPKNSAVPVVDSGLADLPFSAGLLLVSKRIRYLMIPYLYDRPFHMQCSPEAAIRFLRAHWPTRDKDQATFDYKVSHTDRKRLKSIQHLTLYFDSIELSGHKWHALMECIRHEYFDLKTITLRVGSFFWLGVERERGAAFLVKQSEAWKEEDEYVWKKLLHKEDEDPHLSLQEFAKIAAPAKRYWEDNPKWQSEQGTRARVMFEFVDCERRIRFVKELQECLLTIGLERPWYDGKRRRFLRTLRRPPRLVF